MTRKATAVEAVNLESVYRGFGPVRAVVCIDLDLKLGEIAALLGPKRLSRPAMPVTALVA
jgi:ABC-type sugar transport system ATPase subunit